MPHGSPGVLHERREDWRWRAAGPTNFCLPGGKEHGAQRSVPCLWKRSFCSLDGQEQDNVLSWSPATGASTASVFGSDSLDFSHAPGPTPALASASPSALVLPAPDIPGDMSKPKGRPSKYQDGPSPRSVPLLNPAWGADRYFLDNAQWNNFILSKSGYPKKR